MAERFLDMLDEAKNSLGCTEEVVDIVLRNPKRLDELYEIFFQPNEWARMRAASSFKRIWRADPELFEPYKQRWIDDVSKIKQASLNWTFSQMCTDLGDTLDSKQRTKCKARMKKYLETNDDWIVQNTTIEALGEWARDDKRLATWLKPELKRLSKLDKKSVAKRANKYLEALS